MTRKQIIQEIFDRLVLLENGEYDNPSTAVANQPTEMLTIKEAAAAVKGVSEHTIRKLVSQGKVKYIRTGEGERGKILISMQSLLAYFGGVA